MINNQNFSRNALDSESNTLLIEDDELNIENVEQNEEVGDEGEVLDIYDENLIEGNESSASSSLDEEDDIDNNDSDDDGTMPDMVRKKHQSYEITEETQKKIKDIKLK